MADGKFEDQIDRVVNAGSIVESANGCKWTVKRFNAYDRAKARAFAREMDVEGIFFEQSEDAVDVDGNLIPLEDDEGNELTDSEGNVIYAKVNDESIDAANEIRLYAVVAQSLAGTHPKDTTMESTMQGFTDDDYDFLRDVYYVCLTGKSFTQIVADAKEEAVKESKKELGKQSSETLTSTTSPTE